MSECVREKERKKEKEESDNEKRVKRLKRMSAALTHTHVGKRICLKACL